MEIDCACQGKADSAQMAARQEDARQRRLRNRALSELAPIERGNAQGGLARPVAFARRWRLKKGTYGQIRGAKLRCSQNFICNKCRRPENERAYRGAATPGTSSTAWLPVYPQSGEQASAKIRDTRKRLVQILPVMWRHHRPAQAAKERCMQTPTHAKIKI